MDPPLVRSGQYGPARDACVGPHTGLQRSSWHTMELTEGATTVPDDEVWQAIPSHLGIVGSPEGQGEKRGREQVRFVRGDGEGWGGGGPCGEGSSSRPIKSAKTTTVSKPVKKKATVAKVAAKGKKAIKKK